MSRLVPEKRVNKNGVAVTKHVRADPKESVPVTLPSPSVSASAKPPAFQPKFFNDLLKDAVLTDGVTLTVDDLDPEAAQKIESMLRADDQMMPRSYVVRSGIASGLSKTTTEECVAYLHNIAALGDIITGPDSNSMTAFMNGLNHYPDKVLPAGRDYFLDVPEKEVERVRNLLDFTVKANRRDLGFVYDSFMDNFSNGFADDDIVPLHTKITDDELAVYIMDHPEHHDDILRMAEQEGDLSAEVIKGRLNHEVQSLREGFL